MKKYKNISILIVLFVLFFGFKTASGAWFTLRTKAKITTPNTYSATPLKTGQTQCYDASYNPTACSNTTGQDGNHLKGQVRSYTDNGNGTVSDNSTGLMWNKCSEGLSGSSCSIGTATTHTWPNAINLCEGSTHAGYTDWRLPNINELQSLANYGTHSPSINTTVFPNTVTSSFWTSTADASNPAYSWVVIFGVGNLYYYTKTSSQYVRCVR